MLTLSRKRIEGILKRYKRKGWIPKKLKTSDVIYEPYVLSSWREAKREWEDARFELLHDWHNILERKKTKHGYVLITLEYNGRLWVYEWIVKKLPKEKLLKINFGV